MHSTTFKSLWTIRLNKTVLCLIPSALRLISPCWQYAEVAAVCACMWTTRRKLCVTQWAPHSWLILRLRVARFFDDYAKICEHRELKLPHVCRKHTNIWRFKEVAGGAGRRKWRFAWQKSRRGVDFIFDQIWFGDRMLVARRLSEIIRTHAALD